VLWKHHTQKECLLGQFRFSPAEKAHQVMERTASLDQTQHLLDFFIAPTGAILWKLGRHVPKYRSNGGEA